MSATRLAKEAIKIPARIERGPTDILKALASTVKFSPLNPEPFMTDDPYLLPSKWYFKKIYASSYISGKKSARFFLNKYPEMFFRDDAEPKIKWFTPPEDFSKDVEFTEEDIKWCIDNGDSPNAIIAYESLTKKKVKVSDETILDLFELICFTNEETPLDRLEIESQQLTDPLRYFTRKNKEPGKWKTNGLASKIFNEYKGSLDPPRLYSAMIAGLAKAEKFESARQVFTDFMECHKGQALYNEAYVGLIKSLGILEASSDQFNSHLEQIVGHMRENLVKPDLHIFNAILENYAALPCDLNTKKKAFKLINDMSTLKIEPSLGTIKNLMIILCKLRSKTTVGDIPELLRYIEQKGMTHQIRDEHDCSFFIETMRYVVLRLNSLPIAKLLLSLSESNPHLFRSDSQRVAFLNDFLKLSSTVDTLENTLRFYDNYVPKIFQPTPDCYDALADCLDIYKADKETISRIGQDIIFAHLESKITNDWIFRSDPEYMKAIDERVTSLASKSGGEKTE